MLMVIVADEETHEDSRQKAAVKYGTVLMTGLGRRVPHLPAAADNGKPEPPIIVPLVVKYRLVEVGETFLRVSTSRPHPFCPLSTTRSS